MQQVCCSWFAYGSCSRTLEYMETQGVTVIGYGTNEFPAFFSPTSGFPAPLRLDTPEQVHIIDLCQTTIFNAKFRLRVLLLLTVQ